MDEEKLWAGIRFIDKIPRNDLNNSTGADEIVVMVVVVTR